MVMPFHSIIGRADPLYSDGMAKEISLFVVFLDANSVFGRIMKRTKNIYYNFVLILDH